MSDSGAGIAFIEGADRAGGLTPATRNLFSGNQIRIFLQGKGHEVLGNSSVWGLTDQLPYRIIPGST